MSSPGGPEGLLAAAARAGLAVAVGACAASRGGEGSGPAPGPAPGARPADAVTAPADAGDTLPRLTGFTVESSRRQRALERRFLAVPASSSADRTAGWLAAAPHVAGSARQARLADSLAARLERMGFEVEVERFEVDLPYPDSLTLELVAPRHRSFRLREPFPGAAEPGPVRPVEDRGGRPSRAGRDEPHRWTWNAYSADATARGEVVYANYGRAEDYRALRRAGVDVEDKVVLARYGVVYRGTKVREAEERGAAGIILYPDPADGGFVEGDTVPHGPYRPTGSAQRGTVSYLWRYPGDPFTPGRPARPGTERIERERAGNLPSIPVLNVTAARARAILEALGGSEEPPPGFEGGWDLPYRTGPGPALLRMSVRQDYRPREIRNVLARLPGRSEATVVVGNHYDAWGPGGVDPHSGTATALEIARGLSVLREEGWRPRRSILLAFWDAEEFGAVGSTEFVEARGGWLSDRAVAYFNVDVLTAGTLDVAGSPSLRDLVWSTATRVADPIGPGTLADGWRSRGDTACGRPALGPLGVGSDWTAFFHHAGVPSLQWTMNGRGTYAVYHSLLDDHGYLRIHADSGLLHVPALARVMGLAALRLAEADALPFDYVRYADRMAALVDSVSVEAVTAGGEPPHPSVAEAVAVLRAAAADVRAHVDRALARGDTTALPRLNRALPRVERAFLRDEPPDGASGGGAADATGEDRPWYRHLVYTSDPRTGYGALPLPSLQPDRVTGGRAGAPSVEELEAAIRRAAAILRGSVNEGGEGSSGREERRGGRRR